jgi:hypothetical protein
VAFCVALLSQEHADLAALVASWERLPAAVKAGIVAMVHAAKSQE